MFAEEHRNSFARGLDTHDSVTHTSGMCVAKKCHHAVWLHSTTTEAVPASLPTGRPWRFVLLGAPGIGKGTQSELLAHQFGACPLSTGDVFRAAKSQPEAELSAAMREALVYMRSGRLVPDATVIDVVRERKACLRCPGGFLLDGFPRTVSQAESLKALLREEHLELDGVISYELPVEQVVARISGRRICSQCKKSYHLVSRPPRTDGRCDDCGSPLLQREDDRPEAVRVRLAAYESSTAPLIDFYAREGKLIRIPCGETPQETFARTLQVLGLSPTP